ncbi:MAG: hypothetical protein AAF975_02455 [Spirochaetota bacterium]
MDVKQVGALLGRHSAARYREALLALLPPGAVWDAERGDTQGELYRLCGVWAAEFEKLEGALYALHSETSPLTARDLPSWAAATGVSLLSGSVLEQRVKVLAALIGSQASTLEGITGIASMLGYGLRLEYSPKPLAQLGRFRMGGRLWGRSHQLARRLVLQEKPSGAVVSRAEMERILRGLLPAQWVVSLRFESSV